MMKITYPGIQISAEVDPALFENANGFLDATPAGAGVQALKGGRLVAYDANGFLKLADGATDNVLGALVNDATSAFYENMPGAASNTLAVTFGNFGGVTDQFDTSLTIKKGDKLYAGTGAKVGLFTNVAPNPAAQVIAVANSNASAANPLLEVLGK